MVLNRSWRRLPIALLVAFVFTSLFLGLSVRAAIAETPEESIRRIQAGRHIPMPPPSTAPASGPAGRGMTIENGTGHILHVHFSGPVSRTVVVPDGRSESAELAVGDCQVAAEIPGSRIVPFYGRQAYQSFTHSWLKFSTQRVDPHSRGDDSAPSSRQTRTSPPSTRPTPNPTLMPLTTPVWMVQVDPPRFSRNEPPGGGVSAGPRPLVMRRVGRDRSRRDRGHPLRRRPRPRVTWQPRYERAPRGLPAPHSLSPLPRTVGTSGPKARARCGCAACRDRCGGCWATGIPTATGKLLEST